MAEQESSLFTQLQAAAFREGLRPHSKKARNWFRKKAQDLGRINKLDLIADKRLTQLDRPAPGQMFLFTYDPKTKKQLPYYDTFPLILMVDYTDTGFYGLNLHYLPPAPRAKLFDALLQTANNKRFDDSTKLKINYQILKSTEKYKAFRPCFKQYLSGKVKSKIVRVDAPEWPIAMFLPTESFKKASTEQVWRESRKML